RLPEETRQTLQEAAVLGPVFDLALLREMASHPARLLSALEQLRASDFLEDAAEPADAIDASRDLRYRFSNALLQEVAYESLLLRRRTELHARAGLALEGMVGAHPTRLQDIEALARHWDLGGDRRKAAR